MASTAAEKKHRALEITIAFQGISFAKKPDMLHSMAHRTISNTALCWGVNDVSIVIFPAFLIKNQPDDGGENHVAAGRMVFYYFNACERKLQSLRDRPTILYRAARKLADVGSRNAPFCSVVKIYH